MKKILIAFLFITSQNIKSQTADSLVIKEIDSLIKVSYDLTEKKEYDKALEVNAIAEKIVLQKLGRESAAYGSICFNRGRVNYFKRDFSESEKSYNECIIIWEKTLGKEHLDYIKCVRSLGLLYYRMGKYAISEPYCLEVLTIQKKVLGKEHPDYAKTLSDLSELNRKLGNYEKAKSFIIEALAIQKKVNGKEHLMYAWCLNSLGNIYKDIGNYESAEPLYLEALAIRKKVLGKEHPDVAGTLNNLAILHNNKGNYEKAELLHLEVLSIREKVFGKVSPEYANSLSNLGDVHFNMGNYEKAEPLILEAKDIREKMFGKEHPDFAFSLNNLAILYFQMGNYKKSEPLYYECKAIKEKVFGKEHPDYANSLNNLAALYYKMGNYEKAEPFYLEALTILGNRFGKQHPDYAWGLNNLALLYQKKGNYEKAEAYYLEALVIWEKMFGKEHRDYASGLHNMAYLYFTMGNYEKALPISLESKAIRKKVLGKEHPDYNWNLFVLINIYEITKLHAEAEALIEESLTLDQSRLLKATKFLSEVELSKYISSFQDYGSQIGSYLLGRLSTESYSKPSLLPSLFYNHALFHNGFILYSAIKLNEILTATKESAEIHDRLKVYRRQLAVEYSKPIAARKDVTALEDKANATEKELSRSVTGYSEAIRQTNWLDVKTTLKLDEAALEFVSFNVNFPKQTDSFMYAALLLKSGDKQPQFIPLFEEKSLDSLLRVHSERKSDYVNNLYTLADRGMITIESPKRSLYEILWEPLEKHLEGIKTIYFSPTGLIHRINIDAIPISESETLADRYQLIELNSTRQLVIPNEVKIVNNNAVLFGGIQFEQDSSLQLSEPLVASRSRGELSFTNVDSTLRGGSWNYLLGTEREVNSLEKMMLSSGIHVEVKKGNYATEESFKNIGINNSPSPRIIHIATHGYFIPDPERAISANSGVAYDSMTSERTAKAASSRQNKRTIADGQEPIFKLSDHPMLRSGLILAGGNAAWQGKQTLEGREDGVLTAYEISQMNLSNTELVVLSACETGLGEIQGNEGVYGLQRAFKIAGAKYLIMSLWQVPDKQTSLLMTTFYKKWLEAEGAAEGGNKMTIPDAFHAAQKELRDAGLDPYQWAGFVLVE